MKCNVMKFSFKLNSVMNSSFQHYTTTTCCVYDQPPARSEIFLSLLSALSDINQNEPQCSVSTVCPPNHFSIQLRSGTANIIGPKICFDGKTIMSHVMNNVGRGLNIAVLNGETGAVEKFGYLNMRDGNSNEILAYLKEIKTGRIVLVASYDDVAEKLTDKMREIFVEMGSSFITSVRTRDSWVFAGRAGTEQKSLFEKQAVNDAKTNVYEGWPDMVEVSGCFPRTETVVKN
uniref:FAM3 metabolism regulating signaling molecule D n=1 Tax=Seriola dumerili TaxID=41447 RepID=A0A3B4V7B1_SERDU